jgi:hypothetical protein
MAEMSNIQRVPATPLIERVEGLKDRGQPSDRRTKDRDGEPEPSAEGAAEDPQEATQAGPGPEGGGDGACANGPSRKGRVIDIKA